MVSVCLLLCVKHAAEDADPLFVKSVLINTGAGRALPSGVLGSRSSQSCTAGTGTAFLCTSRWGGCRSALAICPTQPGRLVRACSLDKQPSVPTRLKRPTCKPAWIQSQAMHGWADEEASVARVPKRNCHRRGTEKSHPRPGHSSAKKTHSPPHNKMWLSLAAACAPHRAGRAERRRHRD
jgi:hypothetical protein